MHLDHSECTAAEHALAVVLINACFALPVAIASCALILGFFETACMVRLKNRNATRDSKSAGVDLDVLSETAGASHDDRVTSRRDRATLTAQPPFNPIVASSRRIRQPTEQTTTSET